MLDKGDGHIWDSMYNCHNALKSIFAKLDFLSAYVCMYVSSLNSFTNSGNSDIAKNLT